VRVSYPAALAGDSAGADGFEAATVLVLDFDSEDELPEDDSDDELPEDDSDDFVSEGFESPPFFDFSLGRESFR